jgi:hypothetical protein
MLQPTVWLLKQADVSAKNCSGGRVVEVDVTVADTASLTFIRTTLSDGNYGSEVEDNLEYVHPVVNLPPVGGRSGIADIFGTNTSSR